MNLGRYVRYVKELLRFLISMGWGGGGGGGRDPPKKRATELKPHTCAHQGSMFRPY